MSWIKAETVVRFFQISANIDFNSERTGRLSVVVILNFMPDFWLRIQAYNFISIDTVGHILEDGIQLSSSFKFWSHVSSL